MTVSIEYAATAIDISSDADAVACKINVTANGEIIIKCEIIGKTVSKNQFVANAGTTGYTECSVSSIGQYQFTSFDVVPFDARI